MSSLPNKVGSFLPKSIADWCRPRWWWLRDWRALRAQGGGLRRERAVRALVARRRMADGRDMSVVVRSYKEFRRVCNFGAANAMAHPPGTIDLLDLWLRSIKTCETFYDVGSANGLEGFAVNHYHKALVVFIEPFTPSIETILRTAWLRRRDGAAGRGLEVVHAGCGDIDGYARMTMHAGPFPGETLNSFDDPSGYQRGAERPDDSAVTQWVRAVTLDGLSRDMGLPRATHVKVDVDGVEDKVLEGAKNLLASGHVESWALEICGEDRVAPFRARMEAEGYSELAFQKHYPRLSGADYVADHIFVREDLIGAWAEFPRGQVGEA